MHRSNSKVKDCMWKGEAVTYRRLHKLIRLNKPEPEKCEECGVTKSQSLDLANISQKYTDDVTDWEYLCRHCHMIKDGRLKRFEKTAFRKPKQFARCGNGVVARGICLKQYNYERRKNAQYVGTWATRQPHATPCTCGGNDNEKE